MTNRLLTRWESFGWSLVGIALGTLYAVAGVSALALVWFVVVPFIQFIRG